MKELKVYSQIKKFQEKVIGIHYQLEPLIRNQKWALERSRVSYRFGKALEII